MEQAETLTSSNSRQQQGINQPGMGTDGDREEDQDQAR